MKSGTNFCQKSFPLWDRDGLGHTYHRTYQCLSGSRALFSIFSFFVSEKMCLDGPGSSNLFESQLVNLKTSYHFTGLKQIFVHIYTAKLKNKFLVPLDITRPQTRIIPGLATNSIFFCFLFVKTH